MTTNVKDVKRSLSQYEKLIAKKLTKGLTKATTQLKKAVSDNISNTDHSLDDLAALGHPYGLAGGAATSFEAAVGKKARGNIHSPDYLIHKHSGEFKSALFRKVRAEAGMGFLGGSILVGEVGFNEDKCKYARYVIMGTRKMVSRDVLTETMQANREDLLDTMKKSL